MKEKLLNNVRKRVMVWVALASMATLLPAQTYRLSGCVQDENRQPVEVANVLLKQAKDSTYITGMLTDTQGCFSFDQPCLLYTSPSPRDRQKSRMPSSA